VRRGIDAPHAIIELIRDRGIARRMESESANCIHLLRAGRLATVSRESTLPSVPAQAVRMCAHHRFRPISQVLIGPGVHDGNFGLPFTVRTSGRLNILSDTDHGFP
jgi:hypothetical protein